MTGEVKDIVIVGGGSAGWITAAVIAAEWQLGAGISVTLVESPDIGSIGVGEGTWPSMRETLRKIGISETDFIRECDATFKQGSKFVGWVAGGDDYYYHPFTMPEGYGDINLAPHWQVRRPNSAFAEAVCAQSVICEKGLAPKQIVTPEFARNLNYGYHVNAGKFGELLRRHSVERLSVKHVLDDVVEIEVDDKGDIEFLRLKSGERVNGDLFIDCTGFSSMLMGKHYNVPWVDKRGVLFNDTALAVQVPYQKPDGAIASVTKGTAQNNGWIWDIGLSNRRGVGHVFSSQHTSVEAAELELIKYLQSTGPVKPEDLQVRKIQFQSGHRKTFWYKNCVAIGLSAGFIEPLEATALVLIEVSARMLADELPRDRQVMDVVAKRFNKQLINHWNSIIDFLKLHYVLTSRSDSDYWRDHADQETIPDSLAELMLLWQYRAPWVHDNLQRSELFPSASYQYVLYGMKPEWPAEQKARRVSPHEVQVAEKIFQNTSIKASQFAAALEPNRDLIEKIKQQGLRKA